MRKKSGTARQATDDNIIWCREDAVFVLDNKDKKKHKHTIFNTFCFTSCPIS